MLSGGIELLCDSTRKHIHRTLKYELGDSVQIFPDNKGKLLMVPDSVSLQDVMLENQGLRRELEIWKNDSYSPALCFMILQEISQLLYKIYIGTVVIGQLCNNERVIKTTSYHQCNAITYFLPLGVYTFPKITIGLIHQFGTNRSLWLTAFFDSG